MSRLLVRIVLATLVPPVGALIYVIAFILYDGRLAYEFAFLWSGVVTAVFVCPAWLSIWRKSVRWTPQRKWGTLLLAIPSLTAAALCGLFGSMGFRGGGDASFTVFIGSTLGILFWMGSTALLWQETADERAQRAQAASGEALFCPRCGYNLTGLYEATCPECGSRFTLNQIYAAQHREDIGDAVEVEM